MVSLLAIAVVLITLISWWGKTKRNTRRIRDKILTLQKSSALHSERIENLSDKDIASLRIYKTIVLCTAAGIGLVIIIIISLFTMDKLLKLTAMGLTIATFLAFLLAVNRRMDQMFEGGEKMIVRGIVTDKKIGVDGDNDKAYHWIYVGDRKVKVEMALYMLYDIGNVVEFHVYDRFGTYIIHHEKVDGVGIGAE